MRLSRKEKYKKERRKQNDPKTAPFIKHVAKSIWLVFLKFP